MKIVYEYSHLGGRQILQVDYPKIFQEVHESIKTINDIKKNKVSNSPYANKLFVVVDI